MSFIIKDKIFLKNPNWLEIRYKTGDNFFQLLGKISEHYIKIFQVVINTIFYNSNGNPTKLPKNPKMT